MKGKRFRFLWIGVMAMAALLIFSQAAVSKNAQEERVVVRFNNPTMDIVTKYRSANYDVAAYHPGVYLDIVMTVKEFNALKAQELALSSSSFVVITQTESQIKQNLEKRTKDNLQGYRDYDQMLSELRQIEAQYPNICKLYDIGDSWGKDYLADGNTHYDKFNHEIWAMKVSDNVEIEEDEPAVYYFGEHHAREPISMEMCMFILRHIIQNYMADDTITNRVNDTQIWFVPLVNPNGHKIVTSEWNVWYRKNIRDNNESGKIEFESYNSANGPDGVDPNRNYGFSFGLIGSSDNPNEEIYHGPTEFSEPETQAIRSLLNSHHFVAGNSYHTYGEWVLYPFGHHDDSIAPDNDALKDLAVQMAVVTPGFVDNTGSTQYAHGHYEPSPGWGLYPTSGGLDDYGYGALGIFNYTVEMATEFIPPAEAVNPLCESNIEAAMILLNRVWRSTLTGHVIDSQTGQPVQAEIFISGIDDKTFGGIDDRYPNSADNRLPYMSDQLFGRYYRMLMNGTYDVTFRADGYKPVTINDIQITSDAQTVLDVTLEKGACPVNLVDENTAFSGMAGGSVFIPLTGTDVHKWTITYAGKTYEISGSKTMYRLSGLVLGQNTIGISANGFDSAGTPCSDTKTLNINVNPAACPTNNTTGEGIPEVTLGGTLTIPLQGENVDTWEITYSIGEYVHDYQISDTIYGTPKTTRTLVFPGAQQTVEITGITGNMAEITVSATGFDSNAQPCRKDTTIKLNLSAPSISNASQNPQGPYAAQSKATLSLDTINAASVIIDSMTVRNLAMTPASDPKTSAANTWTIDYTAMIPEPVTATVKNASGQSVTYTWNIEVTTPTRIITGTVTDANTGWPLYAQLVGTPLWTNPVTGAFAIIAPDIPIPFAVTAWADGYDTYTSQLTQSGNINLNIKLDTAPTCAPGYSVTPFFTESFDACALPSGWTVKDNAGTQAVWTFNDPGTWGNLTQGDGCFAGSDSNYYGAIDIDTELISPPIDCSGKRRVFLSFTYLYYYDSGLDILDADVSTDNGITWINVWRLSGKELGQANTAKIDISNLALNQTNVLIRFRHHNANYEYVWEIDDVMLYECIAPTSGGLVVGNVYDTMTAKYTNDVTISDNQGHTAVTAKTPNDPDVNDGFYTLYVPTGTHTLTVAEPSYDRNDQTITIQDIGAIQQDFSISALFVPKNLKITDYAADHVTMTWEPPVTTEGLVGYHVYRNKVKLTLAPVTALTYTDISIELWQSYDYAVSAVFGTEGTPSVPASVNIQGNPAQALNAPELTFTISGQGSWLGQTAITHDNAVALQSSDIDDQESCIITTTVQGPGTIRFFWNASSEDGWDFLRFYIGANTIDPVGQISGEPGWQEAIFDIPDGIQELRWAYEKDSSVSEGQDCGWLDEVTYTPMLPTTLTAALTNSGKTVTLNWTQPSTIAGVQGYNVYRDGVQINTALITGTTFTDTNVILGTRYGYSIRSVDGSGTPSIESRVVYIAPHSDIIYVNAAATGANNGSSWKDAFIELQEALDYALPGDEIWVSTGTYTPDFDIETSTHTGNRNASFKIESGIALFGGFKGAETARHERIWKTNQTILSGDIGNINDNRDNSFHVVIIENADGTAVLDGFIITSGASEEYPYSSGGGIYCDSSAPTLTNLIFLDNIADGSGGGLYNLNSAPALTNVVFLFNAADYGGAAYNDNSSPKMTNITVFGNEADYGGGIDGYKSSPAIVNSIIWGNEGDQISNISGTASVTYSIVEGGLTENSIGTGNIDSDPMFTNPGSNDLTLKQNSPAINAGKGTLPADTLDLDGDGNTTESIPFDLAGSPRTSGSAADIGAYELTDMDQCPYDPAKTAPGICGCGVPDIDTDGDGVMNCVDNCPNDKNKLNAGVCGCGIPDTDSNGDGTPDCIAPADQCPSDPNKTAPGACGCGVADTDTDNDGSANCIDADDDNDGMPDDWELRYQLNPLVNDANENPDGDAFSNIDEYRNNTNPREFNNSPPNAPVLILPENSAAAVILQPALNSGLFSDPDAADTHAKTQWQISTDSNFSYLVLDIESADHLRSLTVPLLVLDGNNTYYWRARYFDNHGAASPWSQVFSFTTSPSDDTDANGVPENLETSASADVDGNGTPDSAQSNILSANTAIGSGQVGVRGGSNVVSVDAITSVNPKSVEVPFAGEDDMILGLTALRINVANPGDTAQVSVFYSQNIQGGSYWNRYDTIDLWQNYSSYAVFGAKDVTLRLQDGGFGDVDGTANSVIVHAGGSGITPAPEPQDEDECEDGKDQDCFISASQFTIYDLGFKICWLISFFIGACVICYRKQ